MYKDARNITPSMRFGSIPMLCRERIGIHPNRPGNAFHSTTAENECRCATTPQRHTQWGGGLPNPALCVVSARTCAELDGEDMCGARGVSQNIPLVHSFRDESCTDGPAARYLCEGRQDTRRTCMPRCPRVGGAVNLGCRRNYLLAGSGVVQPLLAFSTWQL